MIPGGGGTPDGPPGGGGGGGAPPGGGGGGGTPPGGGGGGGTPPGGGGGGGTPPGGGGGGGTPPGGGGGGPPIAGIGHDKSKGSFSSSSVKSVKSRLLILSGNFRISAGASAHSIVSSLSASSVGGCATSSSDSSPFASLFSWRIGQ